MCSYAGKEIVDLCRAIANQEDDVRELLRQARVKSPGLATAAMEVLGRQGDARALAILDRAMGKDLQPVPGVAEYDNEPTFASKWLAPMLDERGVQPVPGVAEYEEVMAWTGPRRRVGGEG